MRIKYKKRLVERAEKHRDLDRFTASIYVDYKNGEDEEFRGCEIGCLATPEALEPRRAWFKKYLKRSKYTNEVTLEIPTNHMIEKIETDFGVCRMLQRVSERFLIQIESDEIEHGSGEPSPTRLGGFVVSFCKALPSGVDVTNERVWEWIESRGSYLQAERGNYNGSEFLESTEDYSTDWTKERKAFLDWLRRGCPKPRNT